MSGHSSGSVWHTSLQPLCQDTALALFGTHHYNLCVRTQLWLCLAHITTTFVSGHCSGSVWHTSLQPLCQDTALALSGTQQCNLWFASRHSSGAQIIVQGRVRKQLTLSYTQLFKKSIREQLLLVRHTPVSAVPVLRTKSDCYALNRSVKEQVWLQTGFISRQNVSL